MKWGNSIETIRRGDDGFGIVRHDGTCTAEFAEPLLTCLAAAILPVIDEGFTYRLVPSTPEKPGWHVTAGADGSRILGWLLEHSQEAVEAMQVNERIVRSPAELAWLLQAADPRVLDVALRIFERRAA